MPHAIHILLTVLIASSVMLGAPGKALSEVGSSRSEKASASTGLPTDRIIIKYKDSVQLSAMDVVSGSARIQALNTAAGVSVSYDRAMSGSAHVLKLTSRLPEAEVQAVADKISTLPDVEYAEPDRVLQPTLTPNDPRWSDQWQYYGTYGMNLPTAWNITTGSSSTVVAVIDTGYRPHADLAGRFVQGYDFISEVQGQRWRLA